MTFTKKRFGQHFLVQPGTIAKIVASFNLAPNESVIEIGPGAGALTSALLKAGNPVTAIEIDRDLIVQLKHKYADDPFTLIEQDILKVDIAAVCQQAHAKKIVGNLPYNISTPILFHLLPYSDHFDELVFMLQKEVVDRICAKPNSKHYGRLSVMLQQAFETQALFDINPNAFSPPPKVMSSMVRLKPYKQNNPFLPVTCLTTFADVVRIAFSQRRKTLRNALKGCLDHEQIAECGIDAQLRAENLSVNDFITLSNFCYKKDSKGIS